MRLLGKVVFGGGLASAATAGWLVAAGVFATSATLVVADPVAPRAQADPDGLTGFDSCAELLDWYVQHGVSEVGPYGWDNPMIAYADMRMADGVAPASGTLEKSVSSSATGTNTQEAAVDEPDVAKTNGTLVARIVADKRLVLVDVSGPEPVVLSRTPLPKSGDDNQLLLLGDHLLVTQQTYDQQLLPPGGKSDDVVDLAYGRPRGRVETKVLDIDISVPTSPEVVSTDRFTGTLLSARQYDDTIRLVTSTSRPELDWVTPTKGISERRATRLNRAKVRATTIEDWLPSVNRNGQREALTDCDDVLHPSAYSGGETLAVTTFDIDGTAERSAVGITTAGQIAYSSADRLYVTSVAYEKVRGKGFFARRTITPAYDDTELHAFDVTGDDTSYVASGEIKGSVRDRWSIDEQDGRLRVAWTRTDRRGGTRNGVTVLAEQKGRLVPTGRVTDLGIDEDIQSVRWFDDLAVVVTFRQTDPLYTIDLSDPDRPRMIGALKIPGYSGYLHPVGDHLLLGLGMDGDEDGLNGWSQAAVFDISDPRRPVRISQASFGRDTHFAAVEDPRAFTWVDRTSTALAPLTSWADSSGRLIALHVDAGGRLTTHTLADLRQDWQARTFELPGRRVAVLDSHRVRLVRLEGR
ncbi:hypothetical protein ABIE44_002512 [Marmoricola sp. OAE513]|uniref:beta-propeller domain-containing protein n=1 Tax=Marmoricola sp. OAE513 TaxID=2817894 RepID=UPI001AE8DC31